MGAGGLSQGVAGVIGPSRSTRGLFKVKSQVRPGRRCPERVQPELHEEEGDSRIRLGSLDVTVLMPWVACWESLGMAVLLFWVLSWEQLSFSGEDNGSSLPQSPGQDMGLTQEHIPIHSHQLSPR